MPFRLLIIFSKMDCFRCSNSIFILVLLSFASCKTDIEKVNKLAVTQDTDYDISENVLMIQSELGRKRAIISAPLVKRWNEGSAKTEFPNGLRVIFYDNNLDSTILTADYGVNMEETREMIVSGNVLVLNYKNESLETEKLIWNEDTRTMSTDTFIIIKTPDEILKGKGMDADEKFINYKIRKISGVLNVED